MNRPRGKKRQTYTTSTPSHENRQNVNDKHEIQSHHRLHQKIRAAEVECESEVLLYAAVPTTRYNARGSTTRACRHSNCCGFTIQYSKQTTTARKRFHETTAMGIIRSNVPSAPGAQKSSDQVQQYLDTRMNE